MTWTTHASTTAAAILVLCLACVAGQDVDEFNPSAEFPWDIQWSDSVCLGINNTRWRDRCLDRRTFPDCTVTNLPSSEPGTCVRTVECVRRPGRRQWRPIRMCKVSCFVSRRMENWMRALTGGVWAPNRPHFLQLRVRTTLNDGTPGNHWDRDGTDQATMLRLIMPFFHRQTLAIKSLSVTATIHGMDHCIPDEQYL